MLHRKKYRIINLRQQRKEINKKIKFWNTYGGSEKAQETQPTQSIKLPQVSEKDSLFAFAANTGEMTSKIIAGKKIFSDSSPRKTKRTSQRFPKEIQDFIIADATQLPLKKQSVDWLYSHEPLPLRTHPQHVPRMITQARKGIIITSGATFKETQYTKIYSKLAKAYGLKKTSTSQKIQVTKEDSNFKEFVEKEKIRISTYEITPQARERAEQADPAECGEEGR